jgi:hypothetical protein
MEETQRRFQEVEMVAVAEGVLVLQELIIREVQMVLVVELV